MNDQLGGIALIIGLVVTLTAFFTVIELLFPTLIAEIRTVADAQPGRSLLIGAVNFFFFGVVSLACLSLGDSANGAGGLRLLTLPGLLIAVGLGVALLFGLSAMAQLLGERLAPADSRRHRSLWGSLSLTLACLLPFVGWFALLPYVGLLGLGALIVGQMRKRRQRQQLSPQE
ncbi:MAG: hypothetical protein DYG89_29215 [Caldilinea sp. CFX5]|nr:hypothetical protein [Caldilinea sp. CFX5]